MRRVKLKHQTVERTLPDLGKITMAQLMIVDVDTEQPLSDDEILDLFARTEITGVAVKLAPAVLATNERKEWPGFGTITEITDDTVVLNDAIIVPKDEFHRLYVLD